MPHDPPPTTNVGPSPMASTLAAALTTGHSALDRPAVWTPQNVVTWRELRTDFQQRVEQLRPLSGQRVGVAVRADSAGIATMAALEQLNCDAYLFDADLAPSQRDTWGRQFALAAILPETTVMKTASVAGDHVVPQPGSVTILTSGTTGEPKAVRHSWRSLTRPVRRQTGSHPPCWFLAFRPHLYAGLQVILQALLNHGTLVVAPPEAQPAEIVELLVQARVEFASATPSYWRRLLMSSEPAAQRRIPLVQITLGGEVVDQAILDQLRQVFPSCPCGAHFRDDRIGAMLLRQRRAGGFSRRVARADLRRRRRASDSRRSIVGPLGQCHDRLRPPRCFATTHRRRRLVRHRRFGRGPA